jgi:NitT/TauT family transport system substrate-binding protein
MKVLTYLDYMNRAGLVSTKTNDWKDIFFSGIHGAPGS